MQSNSLIFAGLTMIAVGGLFYAFVYPYLSGEVQAEKRKAAIEGTAGKTRERQRQGCLAAPQADYR